MRCVPSIYERVQSAAVAMLTNEQQPRWRRTIELIAFARLHRDARVCVLT